mgnify:CR=1 FL=1
MKKYRAFVDTLGIHVTNVVILLLLEMEHVKNVTAVVLQQGALRNLFFILKHYNKFNRQKKIYDI